ncbi:MAG: shikimate dehydrogenase [Gammaproteobacteria bacterium]|uniref:shikimate dehydrogenase n=1 Tax=Rhodoferax sp. TaxID=50421 RepID=UPI0017DF0784|nr:shikimate dehydrogenase [Rhodoferax sp.]MBU3897706.1 shikimate dehydrogenase [Gammaproteobacteria bacterium]MBA3057798.1 shikimate dehydrogenase [Rhodoferax sp.]MBU3998799.1 shikimate dehydrogenase [Gammaproteobacteria bacterium]MBU4081549.1 shikimate dehydrogenase [Gammaproteobacteria bacterium]MBU4114066.1 shikimate dehydrogenase [Gammaproteobacteria bacterium]
MSPDLYCVMGNPVAHSRSPWIHARFAELTGQRLHYVKRQIELGGFAQALHAFAQEGGLGCNVTVPFKFEAAALATQTSERALLAQAANTLSFKEGEILADNTDGVGLVDDIEQGAGLDLQGRRLLLIGAGGAAAGVLGPLILAHPASVTVANRTLDKADSLVQCHAALAMLHNTELLAHDLQGLKGTFDVVINASSSSLGGAAVPVPGSTLKAGALAYDMMYGPAAQGFLTWAHEHGALPRDGLGMLVSQAAEAFLIWRGVRPPAQKVLAELRAVMAQ